MVGHMARLAWLCFKGTVLGYKVEDILINANAYGQNSSATNGPHRTYQLGWMCTDHSNINYMTKL